MHGEVCQICKHNLDMLIYHNLSVQWVQLIEHTGRCQFTTQDLNISVIISDMSGNV